MYKEEKKRKHKKYRNMIITMLMIIITISKSTTHIHKHHFKTTFMCPRSMAGVPFDSVRRNRAISLLHTTCMRSCCNWRASCVAAQQTKNQKPFSFLAWRFASCNLEISYMDTNGDHGIWAPSRWPLRTEQPSSCTQICLLRPALI